ncbi:hypothetical protein SAMN04488136_12934 [Vibrio xiamenensis]|uniref:Uncharacterized protein n=1 Tax=Vibrio xiamenensis TaxID=861298 RepID=A0A1G8F950_9VIBR|nr:hypothetical protein SAMN04488136_12934 [Vibrio xiamenensis]
MFQKRHRQNPKRSADKKPIACGAQRGSLSDINKSVEEENTN